MDNWINFYEIVKLPTFGIILAVALLLVLTTCQDQQMPDVWDVSVDVSEEYLTIETTISDYHGDFIHMSIRKTNWHNNYSTERSPAESQPDRDWSRVHQWFGDMNPTTYLEGRIDNGSGQGPFVPTTYTFKIPINNDAPRDNYKDQNGSSYEYITKGYYYADGNSGQPEFSDGYYEIEIYPWYTGKVNDTHPASNDRNGVQYVHYKQTLSFTNFVIE